MAILAKNKATAVNIAGTMSGEPTSDWNVIVPIKPDMRIAAAIKPNPVHL